MKSLIHIFNLNKKPFFQASVSMATEIILVSRLKYKPDFIEIKSICPIPESSGSFNKNFEEVSLGRANEIWKHNSVDEMVHVLWSGGIDSTLAVVTLLMTLPQHHKIGIHCNLNSIIENVPFYKLLLKNKNITFYNSSVIKNDKPLKLISGDLGDQIFGSELIFRIMHSFGFDKIFSPYDEVIPQLFNLRCGELYGKLLYETYLPILSESPFKIVTAFDFIWWWNFSQKWQPIKFRKHCFVEDFHEVIHFFDSDDFQLWSIFNHHEKIAKTVESYKLPAKKIIYEFDKNENYLMYKKKLPSPFGTKLFYYGIFEDGSKVVTASECLQLLEELNLTKKT